MADETTTQLELFQVAEQPPARRQIGRLGQVQFRYDHAVLLVIGLLIASSVVFALGVERGKKLVPVQETPAMSPAPAPATVALSEREARTPSVAVTVPATAKPTTPNATKPANVPSSSAGAGQFAVQVVSYSLDDNAQRELQRLKEQGQTAFLVKRQQKTLLFVGPFATKDRAKEALESLKTRYPGCFIQKL